MRAASWFGEAFLLFELQEILGYACFSWIEFMSIFKMVIAIKCVELADSAHFLVL